jgi:hypothetical protein
LGRLGVTADRLEGLRIVDCYSALSGRPPASTWYVKDLGNPAEFMISISKALEGLEGPVACVDSLDPFLARFGDRIGKAFVEGLAARMRWMSDRALLTVTPEAHEAALLAHIQSLFDGVIELRIEESGSGEVRRWIRYRDFKGVYHETRWHPLVITGGGIASVAIDLGPCVQKIWMEACRKAVALGYRMAWFGLAYEDFEEVVPISSAGAEDGYLTAIGIHLDDPRRSRGPTGTAARTKEVVVVDDIGADPRMDPWRDEALRRGYRSSAAIPIEIREKVTGVLNVYSDKVAAFPGPIIEKLKSIAREAREAMADIGD